METEVALGDSVQPVNESEASNGGRILHLFLNIFCSYGNCNQIRFIQLYVESF